MKRFWNFMLLTLACAGSAIYTAMSVNTTSVFLLVFTGFLIIMAIGIQVLSLHHVEILRRVERKHFMEGEEAEVHVKLRHSSWVPLFWLVASEKWVNLSTGHAHTYRRIFFPIWQKTMAYDYTIKKLSRGAYELSEAEVYAGDLTGSVLKRKRVPVEEADFIVLPHPLDVMRLTWGASGESDKTLYHLLHPAESMLSQIKDYQQGDSMRRIHWKSAAKHGGLKTKHSEDTASGELLIILDDDPQSYGASKAFCFEEGIRAAAGLLKYAAENEIRARLAFAGDGEESVSNSPVGLVAGYEQLARQSLKSGRSFPDSLRRLLPAAAPSELVMILTPTVRDGGIELLKLSDSSRIGVILLSGTSVLSWEDRLQLRHLSGAGIRCTAIPCRPVRDPSWMKEGITDVG